MGRTTKVLERKLSAEARKVAVMTIRVVGAELETLADDFEEGYLKDYPMLVWVKLLSKMERLKLLKEELDVPQPKLPGMNDEFPF